MYLFILFIFAFKSLFFISCIITLFLIYIFVIMNIYNNSINNIILVTTKIKRLALYVVYYDSIRNVNIFA